MIYVFAGSASWSSGFSYRVREPRRLFSGPDPYVGFRGGRSP